MGKAEYEALWEKRLRSVGVAVVRLEKPPRGTVEQKVTLTEVRFKLDADNGTSVLAVVKGRRGAEKLVAFAGGSTLTEVLMALGKKLEKGVLKWREDRPYGT